LRGQATCACVKDGFGGYADKEINRDMQAGVLHEKKEGFPDKDVIQRLMP